jgi:hypothetical protein
VQDTKFALVPMHTNEEYRLFNKEVAKFMGSNGQPDFKAMAKWWSTNVDGKTIFFKIPEHLQGHFKTWSAVRDEITTMHMTTQERTKFMNIIRSEAHTSVVLDESYSPVVRARKAVESSATVATRNRRAAVADVATTATSPSTSSSPAKPHQPTFINTGLISASGPSGHSVDPAGYSSGPFFASNTVQPSTSAAKKAPKQKECKVCQSVGRNGLQCKGRGNREKCPFFWEAWRDWAYKTDTMVVFALDTGGVNNLSHEECMCNVPYL